MQTQLVLNAGVVGSIGGNDVSTVVPRGSALPYEVIPLKEGDILFKEGDLSRGLYYIHSGSVKVVVNRNLTRGRTASPEYLTKLVSPGEFFGYKELIRGTPSNSMAKAIKGTTVWLYPRETVLNGIQQASPLLKMLLQQLATDIETYEITNQLHYLASVQERIAYQLVVLAEKFGNETSAGISLNLKLTRNEFAQLASTINESFSRHLTDFKNEGLIDISGKKIIIKNLKGLMSKSGNFKV
ncbi:MAG: Crp/Fnr family transcriptional regulator [Bdellovibrionaceae bacterium]|nr:Crp/Fnr family transcriptional regulator [Pseudobdellovibrionaceae bacterium]